MGLSEATKKNLEEKGFHKLFKKYKPKWTKYAKEAHKFAKENITGGNEPRPDDVARPLYGVIESDQAIRDHQYKNKARQRRYIEWYTDYVVDQVLVEPRRGRT